MTARPRNRYLTLALFLGGVIFAGFAVQRLLEMKLSDGLEEAAFTEAGDTEAELRAGFNEAAAEARVVVLLSAGSLSSEQDVLALRRVLREDREARVRILAVWRGARPLRAHTTAFGDGRVRHYWDPEGVVLRGTLEGTVLVHRAGVRWAEGEAMPAAAATGEPARASAGLIRRAFRGGL